MQWNCINGGNPAIMPKEFEEYLKRGVIRKTSPDTSRASFLHEEAKKSYETVQSIIKSIKINDQSANTIIKLSYDIIMELIRSIMLKKGYKASGYGAHEAEVSFLRTIKVKEKEVREINVLRELRNSVNYYGKILDTEYARKVMALLQAIYPILIKRYQEE